MEKFVELVSRGSEVLEVQDGDNKGNHYRLNSFVNIGWLAGANMWIKGAQVSTMACFEGQPGFSDKVGTIFVGCVEVVECEDFEFNGRTCNRMRMVNLDNSLSAEGIQRRLDALGVTQKQRENVAVPVAEEVEEVVEETVTKREV